MGNIKIWKKKVGTHILEAASPPQVQNIFQSNVIAFPSVFCEENCLKKYEKNYCSQHLFKSQEYVNVTLLQI